MLTTVERDALFYAYRQRKTFEDAYEEIFGKHSDLIGSARAYWADLRKRGVRGG